MSDMDVRCRSAVPTNGATSSPACAWCGRSSGATVHALTVPLVTSADGTKFGKSTGGGSPGWIRR